MPKAPCTQEPISQAVVLEPTLQLPAELPLQELRIKPRELTHGVPGPGIILEVLVTGIPKDSPSLCLCFRSEDAAPSPCPEPGLRGEDCPCAFHPCWLGRDSQGWDWG